jgi:hypothetical protein
MRGKYESGVDGPVLRRYVLPRIATVELPEKLNVDFECPFDQTCCGQPMANSGCYKEAKATEELFVQLFHDYDYIIAPSGSCTHHIRNKFTAAAPTTEREAVSKKVLDLVEFLNDLVRTPKVYVRDTGLLYALLGIRNQEELLGHPGVGASWEGGCSLKTSWMLCQRQPDPPSIAPQLERRSTSLSSSARRSVGPSKSNALSEIRHPAEASILDAETYGRRGKSCSIRVTKDSVSMQRQR